MAANQVVLCFDKQEDALLFALAAASLMSAEGGVHSSNALLRVAEEICKARRIKSEGVLNFR
jgi:cell division protein FtsL